MTWLGVGGKDAEAHQAELQGQSPEVTASLRHERGEYDKCWTFGICCRTQSVFVRLSRGSRSQLAPAAAKGVPTAMRSLGDAKQSCNGGRRAGAFCLRLAAARRLVCGGVPVGSPAHPEQCVSLRCGGTCSGMSWRARTRRPSGRRGLARALAATSSRFDRAGGRCQGYRQPPSESWPAAATGRVRQSHPRTRSRTTRRLRAQGGEGW